MVRKPISSGPRWFGRWLGPKRSWPSTLNTGTNTTVTALERARRGLAVEQLAQQPEAGVLAVDLAGVDAALDQDHRPLRPGARRRQRAVADAPARPWRGPRGSCRSRRSAPCPGRRARSRRTAAPPRRSGRCGRSRSARPPWSGTAAAPGRPGLAGAAAARRHDAGDRQPESDRDTTTTTKEHRRRMHQTGAPPGKRQLTPSSARRVDPRYAGDP